MPNIVPINFANRKQLKNFIHFPFQLYKNCTQWVPPLIGDAFDDFNLEKYPFFQHSEAKLFLLSFPSNHLFCHQTQDITKMPVIGFDICIEQILTFLIFL